MYENLLNWASASSGISSSTPMSEIRCLSRLNGYGMVWLSMVWRGMNMVCYRILYGTSGNKGQYFFVFSDKMHEKIPPTPGGVSCAGWSVNSLSK